MLLVHTQPFFDTQEHFLLLIFQNQFYLLIYIISISQMFKDISQQVLIIETDLI